MELPTERPPAVTAAAARRVLFGFGMRELGVAAVAAAALTLALAWHHRGDRAHEAERADVRARIALSADAADVYRDRIAAMQAEADRLHRLIVTAESEPARTWARERARRFDAFVAALNHEADAVAAQQARTQAIEAAAHGDFAAAKADLARAPPPLFPALSAFALLRQQLYERPLAAFSRQSPELYRAFHEAQPALARDDEQSLRAELNAASASRVTPQTMLKADLLAAVAAADDPQVAEWGARADAIDYFENPDQPTLAAWARAQAALRRGEAKAAATEMLAIAKSTVRTRPAFRAALGRALVQSRPDDPAAYPLLAEAAQGGDAQARAWVAAEDVRQHRYAQAQRWLETAASDGDTAATTALVDLYAQHEAELDPDLAQRAASLERATLAEDAPAVALLALGRLYQRLGPKTASKAVACFRRAAAKQSADGSLELARCALAGKGMPANPGQARDAALDAFRGGARDAAAPLLSELLRTSPEKCAGAIAGLFAKDPSLSRTPGNGGPLVDGAPILALKAQVARYFDGIGDFGRAARLYDGLKDASAQQRHTELTTGHRCETCGGSGKIWQLVDCPTCGGTGRQICGFCGGLGVVYVPGSPPCPTCGGSGTVVQDRKRVTCATCGGTGKGTGSVIKQDCTHCEHGYIRCPDCVDGKIRVQKECPDCHGRGFWTLAERTSE